MSTPVTAPEVELINQWIKDASGGDTETGTLLMARLSEISRDLSRWQWIIHGDTGAYRSAISRWLCRSQKFTVARRFALCGRGDKLGVEEHGTGVRVSSKVCGCRFCPRCSRRAGRRFLKKVNGVLSSRPHGDIWHMVFTQQAIPFERLEDTRARFEACWKPTYRKMQRWGLRGALGTYHLVRNAAKAWHWHLHLVVEAKEGVDGAEFFAKTAAAWDEVREKSGRKASPMFGRAVTRRGVAMDGLSKDSQMDMWTESQSEVERALQYCVRDVLQGVEKWIQNIADPDTAEEFAAGVNGAKMHRLFGDWRKAPVAAEDPAAGVKDKDATTVSAGAPAQKEKVWRWIGTMDHVMYHAMRGVTEFKEKLATLLSAYGNQGSVALRMKSALRSIAA